MLIQNFGVINKEHYGMLWYFWSGQLRCDWVDTLDGWRQNQTGDEAEVYTESNNDTAYFEYFVSIQLSLRGRVILLEPWNMVKQPWTDTNK